MTQPTPALDVRGAAKALDVHRNTVYRLIRRRELKATRVGGWVYRIRQSAIDELLSKPLRTRRK